MAMSTAYQDIEPDRAQIDELHGPAVLEFGASWCGFCAAAQPLLEEALEKYPHIPHIKIEDGKGRPLGRSFRVTLWPTLIFLNSGQEIVRLVRPGSSTVIQQSLALIA